MSVKTIKFAKRPSPAALRRVRAAMERDGAVAFDGLFPLPLLERVRREVLRRHESGELKKRGLIRDIAGRYAAVLPFEGPFLTPAFYANPKVLAVMESLLGRDHCIGSLETVIAMPGAYAQHQHIDGPLRFDRVIGGKRLAHRGDLSGLPPYAVGLAVPLCDVDEDNGPTALWLGSHKTALLPKPPGEAAVRRKFREARMTGKFGSAYLFDYRIFHGGTPNLSPDPRPLLMIVFTRSWFRDPNLSEVTPGVVVSRKAYGKITPKYKHLFGLATASRRALW